MDSLKHKKEEQIGKIIKNRWMEKMLDNDKRISNEALITIKAIEKKSDIA